MPHPPDRPVSNLPKIRSTTVAKAALIMVLFTLLSRVIGMVRDMVIAYQFGQSANTDAYVAAFKIPDLMTYLIAGGALASTFIPVFSEYLKNNDEAGAWKTFSVVSTITTIAAVAFVVLAELFTPALVRWLNPGYIHHPEKARLAVQLARIVLPAQIFFMLGGLFMGTLNARGQFLIPSLGPSIYNLGIILGALILSPLGLGMRGLMWGALAGAFVGNFALQIITVARHGLRFHPSLDIKDPGAVRVFKLMLPVLLCVSLPNVDQLISSAFASSLTHGAQTAMQYANRVMLIPIGIFAQAIAIAFFPTMSTQAAARHMQSLRRTINAGLRSILFLTVPASALFYVLAVPIVAILFQHGKFRAGDTLITASSLRWYALGIFAWSAQAILTRGFYALQDSRYPTISGTVMTLLFVGMNWLVMRYTPWGIAGLACVTSVAAALHMASMYVVLRRRMRGLLSGVLIISVLKISLATVVLCSVTIFVERLLVLATGPATHSTTAGLLLATLSGLAGIAAYAGMAWVFRMPELNSAIALLRGKQNTLPSI